MDSSIQFVVDPKIIKISCMCFDACNIVIWLLNFCNIVYEKMPCIFNYYITSNNYTNYSLKKKQLHKLHSVKK